MWWTKIKVGVAVIIAALLSFAGFVYGKRTLSVVTAQEKRAKAKADALAKEKEAMLAKAHAASSEAERDKHTAEASVLEGKRAVVQEKRRVLFTEIRDNVLSDAQLAHRDRLRIRKKSQA